MESDDDECLTGNCSEGTVIKGEMKVEGKGDRIELLESRGCGRSVG